MPFFEDLFDFDETADISFPLMNSSLESMPLEAIVEKVGREPEDDAQPRDAVWGGHYPHSNNSSLINSSLNLSLFEIGESILDDNDEFTQVCNQIGNESPESYDDYSPESHDISSPQTSSVTSEVESSVSTSSDSSSSSSKLILKLTPEARDFLKNNSHFKKQPVDDNSNGNSSKEKLSLKRKDNSTKTSSFPPAKRGRPAKSKAIKTPQPSIIPQPQPDVPLLVNYDEDNEVYCVCRQRNDPSKPMVQCETCEDWFHFACVSYRNSPIFHCPDCKQAQKKKGKKRSTKKKFE